jgi:hypothetical protein
LGVGGGNVGSNGPWRVVVADGGDVCGDRAVVFCDGVVVGGWLVLVG